MHEPTEQQTEVKQKSGIGSDTKTSEVIEASQILSKSDGVDLSESSFNDSRVGINPYVSVKSVEPELSTTDIIMLKHDGSREAAEEARVRLSTWRLSLGILSLTGGTITAAIGIGALVSSPSYTSLVSLSSGLIAAFMFSMSMVVASLIVKSQISKYENALDEDTEDESRAS